MANCLQEINGQKVLKMTANTVFKQVTAPLSRLKGSWAYNSVSHFTAGPYNYAAGKTRKSQFIMAFTNNCLHSGTLQKIRVDKKHCQISISYH
jgi:hypothetical protein